MRTEQEMRESAAPTPETLDELKDYIQSLVDGDHDYGTCVYAMSLAAVAAYNHVARKLGVTGFQASCADLDILKRNRSLDGPFMIIDGSKMVYPQYDLQADLREALEKWNGWAAEEAGKKLVGSSGMEHPDVLAHWRKLAANRKEG